MLCAVAAISACGQSTGVHDETAARVLTTARQVKLLTPEEAKGRLPVRLRGVVVHYNQQTFAGLIVHDGSAGIFVADTKEKHFRLNLGDLVELEGVSGAGDYAPVVLVSTLRVVGSAPLPAAREVSYERLATGAEDAEWVKIRGVIRTASVTRPGGPGGVLQVDVMTGGGRLTARVPVFDSARVSRLVDCEAVLTGACTAVFNQRRQLLDVRLWVPTDAQIEIVRPAPEDPFALPPRAINRLQQYEPGSTFGHRVKVRGAVTLQQPGHSLFIRDESQALLVRTRQTAALSVGDEVEVLGFVARSGYSPVLEDAVYRTTGRTLPVSPRELTVGQAREGNFDGDLVRIEGKLLDWIPNPNEHVLLLQANGVTFQADLPRTATGVRPIPLHSRLRLTGICLTQLGNFRAPQSFRLVLRSADGIAVLQNPPWWTPRRFAWALGILSFVALAAAVWVVLLRRQVGEQTAIISKKIHQEAIFQERHRMAREIHDTLVQSFAAISLQLEAIRDKLAPAAGGSVARHLEIAHRLARESLVEARRSIWALRHSDVAEPHLAASLAASMKSITEGTGVDGSIAVAGDLPALSAEVENNLLYIGREACINAVKHAAARHVRLELRQEDHALRVTVRDDGRGFDPGQPRPAVEHRGFGLMSMEERAQQISAELHIESHPGEGTTVSVTVPLNGAEEERA